VGTQDQLIGRLIDLNRAGVDQVMILPSFDPRFDVLERVARDILPNV
jgi:alkanesulfonate monooxygenase SsuD/methylene tetrahydromethanopterin reductase-like flavin-dependent oxidoreductase (luciferase family)